LNRSERIAQGWRKVREPLLLVALSLGIGGAAFLYLYGYYPLALSHLGWIYSGQDSLQHFLGWQFFRSEPWAWPLGTITAYGYPYGVTLTYTDSIPLVALILKLFNPWLQARFQYLGIWTLVCVVLQCLFAVLILREFTPSRLNQALGAALIILSPPLLFRAFYHTSLVSQWLILFAIYLVLLGRRRAVSSLWWGLVSFLAVTIHPYFLPMVLILFLAALAERLERERKILPLIGVFLGVCAVALLAGYLVGLFALGGSDLASTGFGTYSFNLNSLLNPLTTSQFLPALPVVNYHQDEGYNYLGLGNILLIGTVLISLLVQGVHLAALRRNLYLILACLVLLLISVSTTLTFNDKILLNLPLPDSLQNLTGMFRSSGRFFWPVFYLIVLGGMARLLGKVSFSRFVLAGALIVQILDLQPLIEGKRFTAFQGYKSPLVSDFWNGVPDTFRHIVILPAFKEGNMYAPLAIFAANNGLTLNWGYFARARYNEIQTLGDQEVQNLVGGSPAAETLYVFCQMDQVQRIVTSPANRIAFYRTDYFVLGYDRDNPLAAPMTSWINDRLTPAQISSTSLNDYLASLADNQIVFLAGKGLPFEALDPKTLALMNSIGLETRFDPAADKSYLAVFGKRLGGKGVEILSDQKLEMSLLKGSLLNGFSLPFDVLLRSAGLSAGNYASIKMNNNEVSHNKAGLNLLVYNLDSGDVQSISFTHGYQVVCP
jgi:hypothetical protein